MAPNISLSSPLISYQWSQIFNVLSVIPIERLCGFEQPSAYVRAKSGVIDSYCFKGNYSFPKSDSFINYNYSYRRGGVAELCLQIYVDEDDPGVVISSRNNVTLADPEWMLLLYVAQRQARKRSQTCELCGLELNKIERLRKLWHHAACRNFRPYTTDEEYPHGEPDAIPRFTPWD